MDPTVIDTFSFSLLFLGLPSRVEGQWCGRPARRGSGVAGRCGRVRLDSAEEPVPGGRGGEGRGTARLPILLAMATAPIPLLPPLASITGDSLPTVHLRLIHHIHGFPSTTRSSAATHPLLFLAVPSS
ncbi:hypothetical protein SEVIR_2G269576v4 [Setaria viridis]